MGFDQESIIFSTKFKEDEFSRDVKTEGYRNTRQRVKNEELRKTSNSAKRLKIETNQKGKLQAKF